MPRLLLVALLLVAPLACPAAEWYPGVVHLHSTYSDGVLSPSELAAVVRMAGGQFMIVTDHYNNIDQQMKAGTPLSLSLAEVLENRGGPWGFARYAETVAALSDAEFVAIPGAEIGAKWEPEPGNEASSHTLAIGTIDEADSQVLDEYCEKPGGQQHIIHKIHEWGMLPVAAHPSMLLDGRPGKLSLTGRIDYRYDKRPAAETADVDGNLRGIQYEGLAGVELFNAPNAEQCQSDIGFYLRLIREGYRPFVTAGSDYHGYKPSETANFGKQTWVYAADLTTEGLLTAMSEGRTYAAQHGARLVSMSPMPGEHVQSEKAIVKATVEFASATTSEKVFVVYRDGVEAPGSSQTKPAGSASYEYEWTDTQADGQEHSYVLRVGEVLVTSPGWAGAGTAMRHRFAYLRGNGVWLAAVEGGDHTRLAALDGEVGEAQASPDGKRLWVSAGPWGERTVWAIDLASGERRAEAIASSFALSPDGRWLALAREKDAETPRGSAIAVLRDLATGEERPLLRSALDFPRDYGPQIAGWSRDGGTVFLHGDNGTESSDTVIAVDAGTGRVLRISGGRFGGTTAAGEVLVVGQRFRPQGGKDYFLFAGPPSEGAPWDRVTSRDHSELDASVSPDGLRVAFTTLADDGEWPTRRLCVVGLRGREWAVVLETEDAQTSVEGPQWSHDGEWLMASSTTSSPGGETRRSVRTVSSDGQRRGLLVEDAVPLCWVP